MYIYVVKCGMSMFSVSASCQFYGKLKLYSIEASLCKVQVPSLPQPDYNPARMSILLGWVHAVVTVMIEITFLRNAWS